MSARVSRGRVRGRKLGVAGSYDRVAVVVQPVGISCYNVIPEKTDNVINSTRAVGSISSTVGENCKIVLIRQGSTAFIE